MALDIGAGCTGPFLPATWTDPEECVGCLNCEDPGPPPEPAEQLHFLPFGAMAWSHFADLD